MKDLSATSTGDAAALAQDFATNGYVLLRRSVDAASVQRLAQRVTAILEEQDLLRSGADAVETFRATRTQFYSAVQRLEELHALAHDQSLQRVVRVLVGDDAFVHPQKLVRAFLPGVPEFTTPPHQDFPYIQGTLRTITTWLPLLPCRGAGGALRVLVGSQHDGLLPLGPSPTVAGSQVDVADDDPRWATAEFEPGDVLVFQSTTVHSATPNTSGRVRMSVDFRHQPASEPVAVRALKPSGYPGVPDWPELLGDVAWPSERWLAVPAGLRVVNGAAEPREDG